MTNYNFDFTVARGGTPIVSLNGIGIAFNSGACNLLDNPDKILLGFDSAHNTIGVRTATAGDPATVPQFEFYPRMKEKWVRLSCKDFMKYLTQQTEFSFQQKAIQFLPEFDEDSGMLLIILDEAHKK